LGDSITAGNGVKSNWLPSELLQWRGASWSIGGDETVDTVLTLASM
jgi:phospholipase B1, membrane-associated